MSVVMMLILSIRFRPSKIRQLKYHTANARKQEAARIAWQNRQMKEKIRVENLRRAKKVPLVLPLSVSAYLSLSLSVSLSLSLLSLSLSVCLSVSLSVSLSLL